MWSHRGCIRREKSIHHYSFWYCNRAFKHIWNEDSNRSDRTSYDCHSERSTQYKNDMFHICPSPARYSSAVQDSKWSWWTSQSLFLYPRHLPLLLPSSRIFEKLSPPPCRALRRQIGKIRLSFLGLLATDQSRSVTDPHPLDTSANRYGKSELWGRVKTSGEEKRWE